MKLILTIIVLLLLAGCTIPQEIETTRRGVRGTGSMRPLFEKLEYPNMIIDSEVLDKDDKIYLGRIYVYTKNITIQNETTMENETDIEYVGHRLLGIYNISGEIVFAFKGDNNIYLDKIVYREQIIEEVVRIDLK